VLDDAIFDQCKQALGVRHRKLVPWPLSNSPQPIKLLVLSLRIATFSSVFQIRLPRSLTVDKADSVSRAPYKRAGNLNCVTP
jgi:hypothetical protein